MKKHLLDDEVPGLAQRLRSLETTTQNAVLTGASMVAAKGLSKLEERTSQLLEALRLNGVLTPQEAKSAMALSEFADNVYFDLQEDGAPQMEWKKWFSEARLLRGLAVGFGQSATEDIADAIYELSKAIDDPREIYSFIRGELGN